MGYRIGATKKIYRLQDARRIEVHHPPTLSPYLSKRAPALLCPTGRVAEARAYTHATEIRFPRFRRVR
jgi:hypothetical protein